MTVRIESFPFTIPLTDGWRSFWTDACQNRQLPFRDIDEFCGQPFPKRSENAIDAFTSGYHWMSFTVK